MSNDTKWIWSNNEGAQPNEGNAPIGGYEDPPTRRMAKTVSGTMTGLDSGDTRAAGLGEDATRFQRSAGVDGADEDDAGQEVEPVVGWLVIVKGQGLGRSVAVQRGRSSVGRGEDQRIRLPFGDLSMSRNHAQIVYDPTSRQFYISEGEGTSLTRINGELLMGNAPLKGGELIDLGDATQVRFVPFCGPHFDWSDLDAEPEENK